MMSFNINWISHNYAELIYYLFYYGASWGGVGQRGESMPLSRG